MGAGLEQLDLLHDVPRVREDSRGHDVGDLMREVVRLYARLYAVGRRTAQSSVAGDRSAMARDCAG